MDRVIRINKNIRYKSGQQLVRGQVVDAADGGTSPKYDRKHFKATGEHRWNDEPTFTVGDLVVFASDVTVIR